MLKIQILIYKIKKYDMNMSNNGLQTDNVNKGPFVP
jgi:hypothetical protein